MPYAVGHPIRIKALVILNEGVFTVDQIAVLIGETTNKVSHHIKELLSAGSIELVKSVPVRNAIQHYYRAVEMPYISDAEFIAMSPAERQVLLGFALQCQFAEAMAAFWAGKMSNDPRVWITSQRFSVDEEGREAFAAEQKRSWQRLEEIQAESVNRSANSGEELRSMMGGQLGHLRARKGPTIPS